MPSFMAIVSGDLLPGVAENPTFPILSALAYTTGLGYRPTCDDLPTDRPTDWPMDGRMWMALQICLIQTKLA